MLIIALVIAVLAALFWHIASSNFLVAVLMSSFSTVVLFWLLTSSHFGVPPDAAFFENFFGTLALAAIISFGFGKVIAKSKPTQGHRHE